MNLSSLPHHSFLPHETTIYSSLPCIWEPAVFSLMALERSLVFILSAPTSVLLVLELDFLLPPIAASSVLPCQTPDSFLDMDHLSSSDKVRLKNNFSGVSLELKSLHLYDFNTKTKQM